MPRPHNFTRKQRYGKPGEPWQWLSDHVSYKFDYCLLWPFGGTGQDWYATVVLPTGKYSKAHREMCRLAHGEPEDQSMVAMHSCDNKRCVNPRHLRWGTHAENMAEGFERGRMKVGEDAPRAKLTKADVLAARADRASGMTYAALQKKYGISKGSIWHAVNGTQWKSVDA